MKKFTLAVVSIVMLICSIDTAKAQNNGLGGLLVGLGSGALVGHVITRDVGGAVAGSFIGGTLGMLIGSEMDRVQSIQDRPVYRQTDPKYDSRLSEGDDLDAERTLVIYRTVYVPRQSFVFLGPRGDRHDRWPYRDTPCHGWPGRSRSHHR